MKVRVLQFSLALVLVFSAAAISLAEDAASGGNKAEPISEWKLKAESNPQQAREIIHEYGGNWCNTQVSYEQNAADKDFTFDPALPCPSQGSCDNPATRDLYLPEQYDPIIWIRLKFNVFRLDDGSSPAATQAEVDVAVDRLQADYLPHKLQFIYETEFINSTQYRFFEDAEESGMKFNFSDSPSTKLNIYIVDINSFYIGVGTFPWDSRALNYLGGIIIDDSYIGYNYTTLSHEVGHCIGLWHTFHGVDEVTECGGCYEEPEGSYGDTRGDFCADTDPTPTNFTCSPPGGPDPCSGRGWGDTDVQNYMGYSSDVCQTEFSYQQAGRIQCWIMDVLFSWTDTDVDNDGILNVDDNCPTVANMGQEDSDADTVGNVCDNCESTPNRDQFDGDADGLGDACDDCTDSDDDGYGDPGYVLNTCPDDNCPDDANPSQTDTDNDTYGDACDNCPLVSNIYQYDADGDGTGDPCEAEGVYIQCCLDLNDAYYQEPYTYQFWAVGGVEPYTWAKGIGQFPYGLTINNSTGVLSGTPGWKDSYYFEVIVTDQAGAKDTVAVSMFIDDAPPPEWVCGDADASLEIDIDDVVYLISYIFSGGPAPIPVESGDADCSGGVDIDDVVYTISYIFSGGAAPCESCP